MKLNLDPTYAIGYKSNSQIARVLTEKWVEDNAYCPHCGSDKLIKDPNNSPVLDFHCPFCNQGFELKSKSGKYNTKIVDGEYYSMINRITSNTNPDFFFLNYQASRENITDFFMIPKTFITTSIIEKRNPLSSTAIRYGWTGCNILIDRVPLDGLIYMVKDGVISDKENVISKLKRTEFLTGFNSLNRGWIVDVMSCIDKLDDSDFKLAEMYLFEDELHMLHPNNNNVKAKIRQQLQVLRDMGYIEFCGRGSYRKKEILP